MRYLTYKYSSLKTADIAFSSLSYIRDTA